MFINGRFPLDVSGWTYLYTDLPIANESNMGGYLYCTDGDGINGAGSYVSSGTAWYFGGTGDEGYPALKTELVKKAEFDSTKVIYDYTNVTYTKNNSSKFLLLNGYTKSNTTEYLSNIKANILSNSGSIIIYVMTRTGTDTYQVYSRSVFSVVVGLNEIECNIKLPEEYYLGFWLYNSNTSSLPKMNYDNTNPSYGTYGTLTGSNVAIGGTMNVPSVGKACFDIAFTTKAVDIVTLDRRIKKLEDNTGEQDSKRMVVFGDSIVYGRNNNGYGIGDYIADKHGMTLYDYSHSGATTAFTGDNDIITQAETMVAEMRNLNIVPDGILFDGSTNDIVHGLSLGTHIGNINNAITLSDKTTFTGALEYIIALLQNAFPTAYIIYIRVHRIANSAISEANQILYGERALEVCERFGIDYVDIFKHFSVIPTIMYNTYTADGIHLIDKGYEDKYIPPIEYKMKEIGLI